MAAPPYYIWIRPAVRQIDGVAMETPPLARPVPWLDLKPNGDGKPHAKSGATLARNLAIARFLYRSFGPVLVTFSKIRLNTYIHIYIYTYIHIYIYTYIHIYIYTYIHIYIYTYIHIYIYTYIHIYIYTYIHIYIYTYIT